MQSGRRQDRADGPIYPAYCFPASPTFNKWVKLTAADVHALRHEPGFEGQNIYFHLNHPIRYIYLAGIIMDIDFLKGGTYTLLKLDDSSGATIEVKITHPPPPGASTPTETANGRATAGAAVKRHTEERDQGQQTPMDDEIFFSAGPSAKLKTLSNSNNILNPTTYPTTTPNLTITTGPLPTLHLSHTPLLPGTLLKAKGTLSLFRSSYQLTLLRAFPIPSLAAELEIWEDYAAFATAVLCRPWKLESGEVRELEGRERGRLRAEGDRRRREQEREGERRERRRKWEGARRKEEERRERRRLKEARILDGNALDRLGAWGHGGEQVEVEVAGVVVCPRVRALGGRGAV